MMTRPLTTASVSPVLPPVGTLPVSFATPAPTVRVAYYDWHSRKVEYISIGKDAFLTTNAMIPAISSNGKSVTARVIRANGVNTPIEITDGGQQQLPLMIQYPVEKNGRFIETAYYMSTHPGLITPEAAWRRAEKPETFVPLCDPDFLRERGVAP